MAEPIIKYCVISVQVKNSDRVGVVIQRVLVTSGGRWDQRRAQAGRAAKKFVISKYKNVKRVSLLLWLDEFAVHSNSMDVEI